MSSRIWIILVLQAAWPARAVADAGVVVDQPPNNSGGPTSDTSYLHPYTQEPRWQLLADQFRLSSSATIRRVTFWGFYWLDNPPPEETFRFRVYDSRPSDGLPGTVVHERFEQNMPRTATGNRIPGELVSAREYRFTVDLSASMDLASNVPYWFQVAQIGDELTAFCWETSSRVLDGITFMNTSFPEWSPVIGSDQAFQLSTVPEPATLVLIVSGAAAWARTARIRGHTSRIQLFAAKPENHT